MGLWFIVFYLVFLETLVQDILFDKFPAILVPSHNLLLQKKRKKQKKQKKQKNQKSSNHAKTT